MTSGTVKLNYSQFRAYRQGATASVVDMVADKLASNANSIARMQCADASHAQFTAVPSRTTSKGRVALVTTGGNAGTMAHNAAHNTLIRALGA